VDNSPSQKPFLNCGGQGCRKISDAVKQGRMTMAEHGKKLILGTFLLASVILLGTSQSYASRLLFDRGLPIYNPNPSNLNGFNPTPPTRSNFAILYQYGTTKPTTYKIAGDDFSIGHTGQTYQIDIIRVWFIYGKPSSQYDRTTISPPTFPLTLWLGPAGGTIQSLAATPTLTRIWYSDGENFQRPSDGAWRGVWQLDFPMNLKIKGGQKYQFFLDGLTTNSSGNWYSPSLCDAQESLSNNPHQDGADNQNLELFLVNGSPSGLPVIGPDPYDANVQIFGNLVTPQAACDMLLLD
jgi:hypothetical protein